MSDNPFATPDPGMPSPAGGTYNPGNQQKPGSLQAIVVICLILGILSLMGSCFGGISVGASSMLSDFVEKSLEAAPDDDPGAVFQRLNLQAANSISMLSLISVVLNFLVALPMVIGAIGCLRTSESGRKMLRLAMLLACINCILYLIISVVSQIMMSGKLNELINNYDGPAPKEGIEQMAQIAGYAGIGGAVFGALIAIGFAIFYFWGHNYLNKPEVVNYFAANDKA